MRVNWLDFKLSTTRLSFFKAHDQRYICILLIFNQKVKSQIAEIETDILRVAGYGPTQIANEQDAGIQNENEQEETA